MRVLALVGSMRKGKNTDRLVRTVLDEIRNAASAVTADVLHTADVSCAPCRVVCSSVCTSPPYRCTIRDGVSEILARMVAADAVILGAPQYFRGPPSGFHCLVERLTSLAFFQETRAVSAPFPLVGKPCGLVAVAEYSNPQFLLDYLHDASLILKMRPVRLASFPYLGVGGHGDIEIDDVFRPFERARDLGRALAEAARTQV
jgi:multimeric flavodoxin WrbA